MPRELGAIRAIKSTIFHCILQIVKASLKSCGAAGIAGTG
jgi:hypothetical protein